MQVGLMRSRSRRAIAQEFDAFEPF